MSKKAYDNLMESIEGKIEVTCTTKEKNDYGSVSISTSYYPEYFFSFFMTIKKILKEEYVNGKFPILIELSNRHVKADDLMKLKEEISYVSEKFNRIDVNEYVYLESAISTRLVGKENWISTKGYLADNYKDIYENSKNERIEKDIIKNDYKTLFDLFKAIINTINKQISFGKGKEKVDANGNTFIDAKGDIWIWDNMIFDDKGIEDLPNFPLTWKETMLNIIYNNDVKKKDVYKIVGQEELWEEMQKKWTEDNLKKAKKNYFEGGNKNFAKRILKNLSENKGIEEASRILKEIEELEKNEEN